MSKRFLIVGNTAVSLLKFRKRMIQDIAAEGYEIHCAVYENDSAHQLEELKAQGWQLHTLRLARKGMNPFADLGYTLQLRSLMKNLGPSRMFFYTIKPVIYGGLARLFASRQSKNATRSMAMISGLGFAFMGQSLKQKVAGLVVRILYKIGLRGHDVLVFQNPDDQACFEKDRLIPSDMRVIRVGGSGVPTEEFPLTPLPFKKGGSLKFLMIARALRAKGVTEYVEAASELQRTSPQLAEFYYMGGIDPGGDGFGREEFEDLCQKGSIHYLGEQNDVRPHIAACDVVVLPSYREGLPRSSLEAMSMGRPIVTSDVPGCRETVREGHNGFLVPVRDAAALAQVLRRIASLAHEDPLRLQGMGQNSRALVEERFDVRSVNRALLEELNK